MVTDTTPQSISSSLIEYAGPIAVLVIYWLLNFLGISSGFDSGVVILVWFFLIFLFSFPALIVIVVVLTMLWGKKKYAQWVENFNASNKNKLVKEIGFALASESMLLLFTLFVAVVFGTLLGAAQKEVMVVGFPAAYLFLSVWSKLVVKYLSNLVLIFALLGFIGFPLILAFIMSIIVAMGFIPASSSMMYIFLGAPLGGAPLFQIIITQMRTGKDYSKD